MLKCCCFLQRTNVFTKWNFHNLLEWFSLPFQNLQQHTSREGNCVLKDNITSDSTVKLAHLHLASWAISNSLSSCELISALRTSKVNESCTIVHVSRNRVSEDAILSLIAIHVHRNFTLPTAPVGIYEIFNAGETLHEYFMLIPMEVYGRTKSTVLKCPAPELIICKL